MEARLANRYFNIPDYIEVRDIENWNKITKDEAQSLLIATELAGLSYVRLIHIKCTYDEYRNKNLQLLGFIPSEMAADYLYLQYRTKEEDVDNYIRSLGYEPWNMTVVK